MRNIGGKAQIIQNGFKITKRSRFQVVTVLPN